jgi:hypothetical protein
MLRLIAWLAKQLNISNRITAAKSKRHDVVAMNFGKR